MAVVREVKERAGAASVRRIATESVSAEPVLIGLVGGETRTGRIAQFSPMNADLLVQLEGSRTAMLRAEQVAYIAFDRIPGDAPAAREAELEAYTVKVSGGRTFEVLAKPGEIKRPLGFSGLPRDVAGAHKRVHFYAHGLTSVEKATETTAHDDASGIIVLRRVLEAGSTETQAEREAAFAAIQARRKTPLGQLLVEAGLVTQAHVESALAEQKAHKGRRLGRVLVDMGFVSEQDLAITLACRFDLPFVDLDELSINADVSSLIPREVVFRYGVLAIAASAQGVTVAFADPLAIDAFEAVRFHLKHHIVEVIAAPSQLERYVDAHLARDDARRAGASAVEMDDLLKTLKIEDLRAESEEEDDEREVVKGTEAEGGIVKLVNQIIIDAYRRGASDIHIEPNGKERSVSVRFRIDGECTSYQEIPASYRNQIIARVKIMATLDISERRKPQDGKIRFKVGDRTIELRVATLPTVNNNEDAVLRLLSSSKPASLDKLGLSDRNLRELQSAIRQPYGLILCVGPTGSGKTTTLHSALGTINTGDTKIWTAEDPVEITQPGLRQLQVNPKIGLTFASAMRSFLRADPDVIMVGEMRDHETASTAIEASLTGHLVLSTLHTNSAPETITRLLDMGIDPFSFSDSLLVILAQRLARARCKVCREQVQGTADEYAELVNAVGEAALEGLGVRSAASLRVWHAKGCDACGRTGYKGRVALHELLVVTDEIRRAVAHKTPAEELRRLAVAGGMTTLLADGVAKALRGLTDMTQVLAVASK